MTPEASESWWRSGVLYQIYPLSFADSNGDGLGDLPGIVAHLDHLAWLGVDGIWLSPITVSPNDDWGYDVADYCAVQPDARDVRRPRPARRRGRRARDPGAARLRPQPHQRSAPVVRGVAVVAHRAPARLVRVGRSQARRLTAQQLAEQLRRPGVEARPRDAAVLHVQPPARATRPELVERRGPRASSTTSCASGSTAASPGSGSTCAT